MAHGHPAVLQGALDLETVRKFLIRAFDELEQEPEKLVWAGWEEVILTHPLIQAGPKVCVKTLF